MELRGNWMTWMKLKSRPAIGDHLFLRFSTLSNLLQIHRIIKTVVWCRTEQNRTVMIENTSDLVRACIGHRPVVLGFVDREGGLCWVCVSIRVCHCQTKKDIHEVWYANWMTNGSLSMLEWQLANVTSLSKNTSETWDLSKLKQCHPRSTFTRMCSSQAQGWWGWGQGCRQRPSPPAGDL